MTFYIDKILNRFLYRPFLKNRLKKVGVQFKLGHNSEVLNPHYFSIGDYFYAGPFTYFGTNKNFPVEIGNYVMLGPKCTIQGGNHEMNFEGFMYLNKNIHHNKGIIRIENGVWIGSNTAIVSGADIGEGSIIGAMALVNKKIPPFVVAGGVPIKVLKSRFVNTSQIQNAINNTKSKYSLVDILKIHEEYGITYQE